MHFQFSHEFEGSRQAVASAMLNRDYLPFVLQHHSKLLQAELLQYAETPTHITRSIRYLPRPVIESVGRKKVRPEWFEFVENSTWNKERWQLDFNNVPTTKTIAQALVNQGTIRLESITPSRTRRVTEGEIVLKLPFLLKPFAVLAERLIYTEAGKLLDAEAKAFEQWIKTPQS
jgi:hypothetical protein